MQLIIENQTGFDLELKNSGSLVQSISSGQSVSIGLDNNGSYTLDYVETWLSSGLFSLIKSGVNVIKIQPLPHVEEQLPTNIEYTSGSFSGYAELQRAGDVFVFRGTNEQSDSEFITLPLCEENTEPDSVSIKISNY
jgi:hypothetical protein